MSLADVRGGNTVLLVRDYNRRNADEPFYRLTCFGSERDYCGCPVVMNTLGVTVRPPTWSLIGQSPTPILGTCTMN